MSVSHQFPDGQVVTYGATIRFPVQGSSWSVLECSRRTYFQNAAARALFIAADDLPIPGRADWFMISDFPVEISRHTKGRCMTRVVMDALGYTPALCLPL